jgi:hypothetical protein
MKPKVELGEFEEVTPQHLRDLANRLKARLDAAADAVEKLSGAGWAASVVLYDLILSPTDPTTPERAEQLLHDLGIAPGVADVEEYEEESFLPEE